MLKVLCYELQCNYFSYHLVIQHSVIENTKFVGSFFFLVEKSEKLLDFQFSFIRQTDNIVAFSISPSYLGNKIHNDLFIRFWNELGVHHLYRFPPERFAMMIMRVPQDDNEKKKIEYDRTRRHLTHGILDFKCLLGFAHIPHTGFKASLIEL